MDQFAHHFIPDMLYTRDEGVPSVLVKDKEMDIGPGEGNYVGGGQFGKAYRMDGWMKPGYRNPFLDTDERKRFKNKRSCCLKIFQASEYSKGEAEAKKTAELEYKSLVKATGATGVVPRPIAFGHGVNGKGVYYGIAMEYVPCNTNLEPGVNNVMLTNIQDIANDITRGRGEMSAEEVARLALSIAQAIERVHATGVSHRDLKPDNIAVRCDETELQMRGRQDVSRVRTFTKVCLLDLGNATSIDGIITDILQGTHPPRLASQPYGAPEIFDIDLDRRVEGPLYKYRNEPATDCFSIGCLIYWLYTQKHPAWPRGMEGDEFRRTRVFCKKDGLRLDPRPGLNAEQRKKEQELSEIVHACTEFDPVRRAKNMPLPQIIGSLRRLCGIVTFTDATAQALGGKSVITDEMGDWMGTAGTAGRGGGAGGRPGGAGAGTRAGAGIRPKPAQSAISLDEAMGMYSRALTTMSDNPGEAARLLRQAADAGYEQAYVPLGSMMAGGMTKERDPEDWEHALVFAGEHGSGPCWHALGMSYLRGTHGMRRSEAKAMEAFSHGADLKHRESTYELALLYMEAGLGAREGRNDLLNQSFTLLKRLSHNDELGYPLAHIALSRLHEEQGFKRHSLGLAAREAEEGFALARDWDREHPGDRLANEARDMFAWGVVGARGARKLAVGIAIWVPFLSSAALTGAMMSNSDLANSTIMGILLVTALVLTLVVYPILLLSLRHGRYAAEKTLMTAGDVASSSAAWYLSWICLLFTPWRNLVVNFTDNLPTLIGIGAVVGVAWYGLLLVLKVRQTRDRWARRLFS